ncbi:Inner membrane transport permease ybhR [Weeksella virosa]|uniref:ABC transporter permease n=1 Tax=Weeksella virosa TaxID=1014 RepID=UPI000DFB51D0|nr:ABC transporter permease [Weeksella virosa]SUP54573.1 Inner membrane transport permease ybhR [Weeksella virosa]
MLHRLWQSVKKEALLLFRDYGGLAVLFVMPMILVVMVTMIQNQAMQGQTSQAFPLLFIDHDQDSVSHSIRRQLVQENTFFLIDSLNGKVLNESTAKKLVYDGKYQLALILPNNLSKDLHTNVEFNVEEIVGDFGLYNTTDKPKQKNKPKEIELIFDPAVQENFKNNVKFGIEKIIYKAQSETIYQTFREYLGEETAPNFQQDQLITYKEISAINHQDKEPNAVQHNVPAWTLFAIFFIIVPLSVNLVNEKNLGTNFRLRTSPMPYSTLLIGKIIIYLVVCLLQFFSIILLSQLLFPLIGLEILDIEGKLPMMLFFTIFVSLAAIGLGILLGVISKTQEQAPPFGATFVVILAALGGIWIPVFMMSTTFQKIAKLSPMHWGLSGYYDILLRNASLSYILPEIFSLLLFFLFCLGLSILYDRKKQGN